METGSTFNTLVGIVTARSPESSDLNQRLDPSKPPSTSASRGKSGIAGDRPASPIGAYNGL